MGLWDEATVLLEQQGLFAQEEPSSSLWEEANRIVVQETNQELNPWEREMTPDEIEKERRRQAINDLLVRGEAQRALKENPAHFKRLVDQTVRAAWLDMLNVAATALGGVSEGFRGVADDISRESDRAEQVARLTDKAAPVPEEVMRWARGAGRTLLPMAVGGAAVKSVAGGVAALGSIGAYAGTIEGSQAYTEAVDAGLSKEKAKKYAYRAGAIEAGIMWVFSLAGKGGLEDFILNPKALKGGILEVAKKLGIRVAEEMVEEVVTEISHAVNAQETLYGPGYVRENAGTIIKETLGQTAFAMGMAMTPSGIRYLGQKEPGALDTATPEQLAHVEGQMAEEQKKKTVVLEAALPMLEEAAEKNGGVPSRRDFEEITGRLEPKAADRAKFLEGLRREAAERVVEEIEQPQEPVGEEIPAEVPVVEKAAEKPIPRLEEPVVEKVGVSATFVESPRPKGVEGAFASPYYAKQPAVEQKPTAIELPEMVWMAEELLESTPEIRKAVNRKGSLGIFRHKDTAGAVQGVGEGKIDLKADIFIGPIIRQGLSKDPDADTQVILADILEKHSELTESDIEIRKEKQKRGTLLTFYKKDPSLAPRVMAHEIGHAADWLPEKTMKRGNILGRIATLSGYLRHYLEGKPGGEAALGKKDFRKLRAKAETKEDYAQIRDEEVELRGSLAKDVITDELKGLTEWWSGPATGDEKYRFSSKELYAEALSVLLNSPTELKKRAPMFYEGFFAYMDRKPEVKKVYQEVLNDIQSGRAQTKLVKRTHEAWDEGEKLKLDLRKKTRLGVRDITDLLRRGTLDRFDDVTRLAGVVRREGGLDPELDPQNDIHDAIYAASVQELYLDEIKTKVKNILEDANLTWRQFSEYLFHLRVVNERDKMANPHGWTKARSEQRIDEMKTAMGREQFQTLTKAQKGFWAVRQEIVVKRLKDANMYSSDLMAYIEDNEFYSTFEVAKFLDNRFGSGTGSAIFGQLGTFQSITETATATLEKDMALLHGATWNNAKRSAVAFLEEHVARFPGEVKAAPVKWDGKRHVPYDPGEEGKSLLLFFHEGKQVGYLVKDTLASAFKRGSNGDLNRFTRILKATADPFRFVYVIVRPGFWMFNLSRDYWRAVKNLKGAGIMNFTGDWAAAWKPSFKGAWGSPNDIVKQMLANNSLISVADMSGHTENDKVIERLLYQFSGTPSQWAKTWKGPFMQVFHQALRLGEAMERVPKIAAWNYLSRTQPDLSLKEKAHIIRTQAGSPGFLIKGSATPVLNNLFLFSNPMIQAYRADLEVLRDRPGERIKKFGMYTMMPKMIQWGLASGGFIALWKALGGDDDDEVVKRLKIVKKMYNRMSEYDLANYVNIPLGIDANGKVVQLRIPQDETDRLFGGLFWKLMNGPESGLESIPQILDYTAGQVPSFSPAWTILGSLTAYATGRNPYDHFRGRYVLPENLNEARNAETRKYMAKWLYRELGGDMFYKFKGKDHGAVKTELEEILGLPVLSDTVGRFIKSTNYGLSETLEREGQKARKSRARELEGLKEAVRLRGTGRKLTVDQERLIEENPDYVKSRLKTQGTLKANDPYAKQLLYAKTRKERFRIQVKILDLEGPGFDLAPYVQSDIRSFGKVLAGPKQSRQELREAVEWFKERRITSTQIWKAYGPEISKFKKRETRGDYRKRLSRWVSKF